MRDKRGRNAVEKNNDRGAEMIVGVAEQGRRQRQKRLQEKKNTCEENLRLPVLVSSSI
jgi:hypothetical protein